MRFISRWLAKLGLWPRMAVLISLGFGVLFVAFSALGEWALQESTSRLFEERLVITQMAASQIDQLLQRVVAELAQAPRFAAAYAVTTDLSAEAEMLTHTYAQVGDFTAGVTFIDPNGQVVLSHPPELYSPGTNLAAWLDVADALDRRQVTISEPFNEPLGHRPVVAVTVPIFHGDHFAGLLSGLLDLNGPAVIKPLQEAATLGHTGHAALVDRQGRVLASTFELLFLSVGEHVTFYRRAIAQGQPLIETVPFELELPNEPKDHNHVMAFVPLQEAAWGVAVGGDEDETLVGVRRLRLGLALLSIAALAGVWAITLASTRKLVGPIQRLTEAAQRIAVGELDTPLPGPQHGEIGTLVFTLERMRRQLLTNIDELADWNETLEIRVAQQTGELRQQQRLTRQLLRRVITAQEEERARLAREMHDGIGQTLTAVELSLGRLTRTLPPQASKAHEQLEQARRLTEEVMADLRRVIAALRPGILDQQ